MLTLHQQKSQRICRYLRELAKSELQVQVPSDTDVCILILFYISASHSTTFNIAPTPGPGDTDIEELSDNMESRKLLKGKGKQLARNKRRRSKLNSTFLLGVS